MIPRKHFIAAESVVFFNTTRNIRKQVFEFEEILNQENNQYKFSLMPFDDNEDPELPRMIAQYRNDRVSITQQKLSVLTLFNFDAFSESEFGRIFEKKARLAKKLSEKLDYQYSGCIVRYVLTFESKDEVWNYLRKEVGAVVLNKDLTNFSFHYAFKHDSQYYVNVTIGNFEKLPGFENYGLEIVLDINDKILFQVGTNNSPDHIFEIISSIKDILEKISLTQLLNGEFYAD